VEKGEIALFLSDRIGSRKTGLLGGEKAAGAERDEEEKGERGDAGSRKI